MRRLGQQSSRPGKRQAWATVAAALIGAALAAVVSRPGIAQRNVETLTGKATVLRGDLIQLEPPERDVDNSVSRTQTVRLWGISAPFLNQTCKSRDNVTYPCGEYARDRLETLIDGQNVTCNITYTDLEERRIGRCWTQRWKLNEAMVVFGWAITYRQMTDQYLRLEEAAKKAERGLWAGSLEPPWIWHSQNPDKVKYPEDS